MGSVQWTDMGVGAHASIARPGLDVDCGWLEDLQ